MKLAMLLLAALLVVPACGLDGSGEAEPTTIDGVTLLRHGGSDSYPAGLGSGTVVVRDGCVAMKGERGPGVFVLWPPGYDLRTREGRTEVLDADGDLVGASGDPITLGGGFGGLSWADELTDGEIPTGCRDGGVERYFLAADAWPFAEAGGITLLRHGGDRLSGDEALLEGTLSVIEGCVAIEGGPWLLWPIDYGLSQDQQPPLEIEDGQQRVVASIGEHVRLGGGIDDSMPDPPGLPGGIPDGCRSEGEHYWYVGDVEVAPP